MNYLEPLNSEEIIEVCKVLTGEPFLALFKSNPNLLSQLQGGFRAKTLTEKQALRIATNHINDGRITGYVNNCVEHVLLDMRKQIRDLEDNGYAHSIALASVLIDSPFSDHIELYLKVEREPADTDTCENLQKIMNNIRSEIKERAELSDQIKALKEEKQSLSEQLEMSTHDIEVTNAESKQKIESLTSSLSQAQKKIAELETTPTTAIIDDPAVLAQYDDTNLSLLPDSGTEETISLCSVTYDESWLTRFADLNKNGEFIIFRKDQDRQFFAGYRDKLCKLHRSNGPSEEGFYGIWKWYARPNDKDSSKAYIVSDFMDALDAIEIVVSPQASNLNELVEHLKKGINHLVHSRKTMFAIKQINDQYIGILFNEKQLNTKSGITTISKDCNYSPVYQFSGGDIIHFDTGLSFYRKAFTSLPVELYPLKKPLEIVKDSVLSSISWSAYKSTKIKKSEMSTFKDFIDALPAENVLQKIATQCHCSKPAAQKLLDQFLDIAWKYVDGDTIEDEIISSALTANPTLKERATKQAQKSWEEKHERKIAEKQNELDLIQEKIKAADEELNNAQDKLKETKVQEQKLADVLANKEKLADDVEKSVNERIRKAQENAADFIANMAFVSGPQVQVVKSASSSPAAASPVPEVDHAAYRLNPASENLEDSEPHRTLEGVINTTSLELSCAGVSQQYTNGLAAFLCAAYIQKQPLFLVGPNAIDIVQAFSAALEANKKYGVLDCEGEYASKTVSEIGVNGEDIVLINNLIGSGWINRLPEILSQKRIFYIATHPYAEDIQAEPKSLYGFMLPLFTEILVDKKATGGYVGGYCVDDHLMHVQRKGASYKLPGLSRLALSTLVKNNIRSLASTMHDLYPMATANDDFVFCIFPIAYALLETDELTEIITDPQIGVDSSNGLKRDLQFVLGGL